MGYDVDAVLFFGCPVGDMRLCDFASDVFGFTEDEDFAYVLSTMHRATIRRGPIQAVEVDVNRELTADEQAHVATLEKEGCRFAWILTGIEMY